MSRSFFFAEASHLSSLLLVFFISFLSFIRLLLSSLKEELSCPISCCNLPSVADAISSRWRVSSLSSSCHSAVLHSCSVAFSLIFFNSNLIPSISFSSSVSLNLNSVNFDCLSFSLSRSLFLFLPPPKPKKPRPLSTSGSVSAICIPVSVLFRTNSRILTAVANFSSRILVFRENSVSSRRNCVSISSLSFSKSSLSSFCFLVNELDSSSIRFNSDIFLPSKSFKAWSISRSSSSHFLSRRDASSSRRASSIR